MSDLSWRRLARSLSRIRYSIEIFSHARHAQEVDRDSAHDQVADAMPIQGPKDIFIEDALHIREYNPFVRFPPCSVRSCGLRP